jgi:Sortase and related acyltransferases
MVEVYLATEDDISFFYEIKNNEDNMYWSGHSAKPVYDKIRSFFIEQIQNQNIELRRKIYIIADNSNKVKYGYLYLDPIDSDTASVSIAVLDKYSGNGIGRNAMKSLMEVARNQGYKILIADIREDNIRSQRLFGAVGFHQTEKNRLMYLENISKEVRMLQYMSNLV